MIYKAKSFKYLEHRLENTDYIEIHYMHDHYEAWYIDETSGETLTFGIGASIPEALDQMEKNLRKREDR